MLCRAYRLMEPAPEIMAGALHLQHVFATPQDLDRLSSLLLGVQPSKIKVNLRESMEASTYFFAFKLNVVTRLSIIPYTDGITYVITQARLLDLNILFHLYGSCTFGFYKVLKHLYDKLILINIVPGVEY